jgi:hypothetical protein
MYSIPGFESLANRQIILQSQLCFLCREIDLHKLMRGPARDRDRDPLVLKQTASTCWMCNVLNEALSVLPNWPDGYLNFSLSELPGSSQSPHSQLITFAQSKDRGQSEIVGIGYIFTHAGMVPINSILLTRH